MSPEQKPVTTRFSDRELEMLDAIEAALYPFTANHSDVLRLAVHRLHEAIFMDSTLSDSIELLQRLQSPQKKTTGLVRKREAA